MPEHDDDDGYQGPARLTVGDDTIDVDVVLGGHLEPLDGKYHWYGRIARDDVVDAIKSGGATDVGLIIGAGIRAAGRLAEHDAWGNLRITGTGPPPFERPEVEIITCDGDNTATRRPDPAKGRTPRRFAGIRS